MRALEQNHPQKCLKEEAKYCSPKRSCCNGLKCVTGVFGPRICISNPLGDFKRKCKNKWFNF